MQFNHIGIFVSSLQIGRSYLENILNISDWTDSFDDPIQKVSVQFGKDVSGVCYEIIAPYGKDNPVETLLLQSKNILNHVAYNVDNINTEIIKLQNQRCILISGPSPAIAFNNNKIAFLYTPLKFVIELIENEK
jgi:methylmalonyl-CoA/ethylmalonyl-CoA epimerase